MHFGIAFPTYIDAWRDAEIAEANGFTHAWFYDSQLLYSDVWASMALAAEHTRPAAPRSRAVTGATRLRFSKASRRCVSGPGSR